MNTYFILFTNRRVRGVLRREQHKIPIAVARLLADADKGIFVSMTRDQLNFISHFVTQAIYYNKLLLHASGDAR